MEACTEHHLACACREEHFQIVETQLERFKYQNVFQNKTISQLKRQILDLKNALRYCSIDDPYAVDQSGKLDLSTANEWKKVRAREELEKYD